ncbi:MAG: DUF3617 domain-containing protein [Terriglobia bacterium]
MRKAIFSIAVGLGAAVLLAAGGITPLHVKTGLWETSMTSSASGQLALPPEAVARLTPEQRTKLEAAMGAMASHAPKADTSQHCVTQEELTKDPFTDKGQNRKWKCDETVIKSTGSELALHEVCGEGTSKWDAHISMQAVDSEHTKGAVLADITMGGRTMHQNMNFTSKWIGASCPAGE